MPGPVQTPKLETMDGQSSTGKTLEVPASGLSLVLRVPSTAPARVELTQAELVLEGPAGTTDLAGGTSPGLVVATNLGPLSANWKSEQENDVTWLTADWGARRSLVSITLASTTASDPNVARLKVSDGSVWFPPLPVETVPFNREQPLPDIVASRLMIEVVRPDAGGVLKPATGRLKGITVKLAGQPSDVSVHVGEQPPLPARSGRLLPGQQARVAQGLREALQAQVPGDGTAARVPVVIRATLPGSVKVAASTSFAAQAIYTALDEAPASLPLPWGGEAVGRVTVGEGATLVGMSFTLVPELTPQRLLLEGPPETASTYAQLCDARHVAAQGFPGLGEAALAGVDLLLRPITEQVSGVIALHPDEHGRPGAVPYGGAQVPFTLSAEGPAPWKPRWIPVPLPRPVLLKERWWLVLGVSQGEALWPLATTVPSLEGGLGPALHRLGAGAWFPWEPPPVLVWAPCRLQVTSQAPAPPFEVELRRGAKRLLVTPDASGRVEVPVGELADLKSEGATVELAVRSKGPPVTGAVRLADLRVVAR